METPQTYYDDEIDLREIVRAILAKWRWIAAATIISAAVALGVSLLLPKKYQASAYVALTKPDVVFRFDPRITTEVETPAGAGIPELALSDDVIQQTLDILVVGAVGLEEEPDEAHPEKVEVALTGTILQLLVEDNEPEMASSFANSWAETVVNRLNTIYAPSSRSQELFEDQADEALMQWEAAQQALIDFQLTNPELALSKHLIDQEQELMGYLEAHRSLGLVLQDAKALVSRLREVEDAEKADLRDELATLLLTIRSLSSTTVFPSTNVYSGVEVISSPVEVQIQAQDGPLLNLSVDEHVGYLERLIVSIEAQRVELDELVDQQESEIYVYQSQLAEAFEGRSRLEQERDLALEAYQALARKTQELSLTPQDQDVVAKVASRALLPTNPVEPRVKFNTIIGGTLGGMFGLVLVFILAWWRGEAAKESKA